MGSKAFEHNIAGHSDILVQRLESEGGVVYAMSNTPEFGAGWQHLQRRVRRHPQPHDLRLTPGGSSGGAAAAVASGMAWVAHGSDLAGSLRTPASFCGITSLRPSPGLFASGPSVAPFDVYGQDGPMARDVADLALLADAMQAKATPQACPNPEQRSRFSRPWPNRCAPKGGVQRRSRHQRTHRGSARGVRPGRHHAGGRRDANNPRPSRPARGARSVRRVARPSLRDGARPAPCEVRVGVQARGGVGT